MLFKFQPPFLRLFTEPIPCLYRFATDERPTSQFSFVIPAWFPIVFILLFPLKIRFLAFKLFQEILVAHMHRSIDSTSILSPYLSRILNNRLFLKPILSSELGGLYFN